MRALQDWKWKDFIDTVKNDRLESSMEKCHHAHCGGFVAGAFLAGAAVLGAGQTRVTMEVTGTVDYVEGSYASSMTTGQMVSAIFVYDTNEALAGPDSQSTPSTEPGHEFSSFYSFESPPCGAQIEFGSSLSFSSETAAVVVNDNLPILGDDVNGALADGTYDWIEVLGATTLEGPVDGEEWTLALFADTGWILDGSMVPDDLPDSYTPVMLGIDIDVNGDEIGIAWIDITSITVTSSDPTLRILSLAGDPLSGFQVDWSCEAGNNYQLQYSESMQQPDWLDLGPSYQPAFGVTELSHNDPGTSSAPQRLYRVVRSK